jgi:hypothetical protein
VRTAILLTVLAFVARAAFLLLAPACHYAGDEPSWIALGTQELVPLSPLRNDLIFYPPLYPYFIAFAWRALGSLPAVLWVQAGLGALLAPAVARVGTVAFGPRAGAAAGVLAALYPDLVWFATRFWSETLFIVLLWWAIERALAADTSARARTAAAAGFLFGLATLTRELAIYLVPLVVLWLLRPRELTEARWQAWLHPPRRRVAAAAALVAACVLTVLPWTVRNAVVFRTVIPVSTMGGLNLWQGNTTLTHLEIYDVLARIPGPVAQDRYCREKAWETIAARQPGWLLEKLAEQMPELVPIELWLVVPYLVLLALFVVGLARLRFGAAAWLLLLLLAAYNAAHVVAYATTRFRLPVMPVVFMVGAALATGARDGSLAPLRGRRLGLLVLLAAAALWAIAPGLEELASYRLVAP